MYWVTGWIFWNGSKQIVPEKEELSPEQEGQNYSGLTINRQRRMGRRERGRERESNSFCFLLRWNIRKPGKSREVMEAKAAIISQQQSPGGLLHFRHCSECLVYISSFNLRNNPIKTEQFRRSLYRRGDSAPEGNEPHGSKVVEQHRCRSTLRLGSTLRDWTLHSKEKWSER